MFKKILLSKVGGNIMLMRVDTETKLIEYTTNGTDWFQHLLEEASGIELAQTNLIAARLQQSGIRRAGEPFS